MNLRERIRKDLEDQVSGMLGKWDVRIDVFRSSNLEYGDYSTNVALKLSSEIKPQFVKASKGEHSSMEFAKKLADSLKNQAYIEKLEVKEPGFINFFIKSEILKEEVENFLTKDKFVSQFTGKKVIVEFTDPNPFKEFHVGHLYSNSVGEAISRMLEAVGAKVMRANYQGDVGLHVAKCIWGMREKVKSLEDLKNSSLDARVKFLGEAYSLGAKEFEEDSSVKDEIIHLNKEIYERLDGVEEYKLGKAWSLKNFEAIYKRLGTKFDFYYFESEVGKLGAKIVNENLKKVFKKSDGAIIFLGEKYGLHNRVFINSQGLPTYEAKELGLAFKKYEDFIYDYSIIVTGSEIVEYFKVLIAAISQIDSKLAAKTSHIAHGMVRMPGGKISSRLGNVISASWLLDEAKKRALMLSKNKDKSQPKVAGDVVEQVAVGAVKYAFLKGNASQDIKFSFEEALALEGNSGPYLQYTHARCKSVLSKIQKVKEPKSQEFGRSQLAVEEKNLLRTLSHFEEVVIDSAEAFAPNQIANFLFELAQKYNNFYNNLRIIDAFEPDRARRLFLTEAAAQVLQKGLNILGISAPQKM